MTGYAISVGYNSGFKKEEVGEALLQVVKQLREFPYKIVGEATYCEPNWGSCVLDEYAASYKEPATDLTITIRQDEDGLPIIRQLASGGGQAREIKEALRRAFCRLVLREMHMRKMEVDITVA